MSVSFFYAGFDIGSIKTCHEMSAELSISSGDDTLSLEYPILDPGPISAEKRFSLKMIVLGLICDSEAHLGCLRHPTTIYQWVVQSVLREFAKPNHSKLRTT